MLPNKSIMEWAELIRIFMHKFSPNKKRIKIIKKVMSFSQYETENLAQAAERYFNLIRKNSIKGISEETTHHIFYNGLNESSKQTLDCCAGGCYMRLTKE